MCQSLPSYYRTCSPRQGKEWVTRHVLDLGRISFRTASQLCDLEWFHGTSVSKSAKWDNNRACLLESLESFSENMHIKSLEQFLFQGTYLAYSSNEYKYLCSHLIFLLLQGLHSEDANSEASGEILRDKKTQTRYFMKPVVHMAVTFHGWPLDCFIFVQTWEIWILLMCLERTGKQVNTLEPFIVCF